MLKITCASIALLALANPALAGTCANPAETAALKTAVMQQELMVAALQCHESGAYNRFVTAYRGELQDSDATLKSFFVRRGGEHGEAGYDTFKTKAANLSALEQARDTRNFCADAHALFTAALENHGSLASFVNARASDIGSVCTESRPAVVTAAADRPPIAAPTRAVIKIADVAGAKTDMKPEVKLAKAEVKADVVSVPDHAPPALPWRHEEPAPARVARAQEPDDYNDDGDDARPGYATADADDLPPPRARAYEIREQQDDGYYGNAPYADRRGDDRYGRQPGYGAQAAYGPQTAYGPPPGWYPQPRRYRWAPPPGYYNW